MHSIFLNILGVDLDNMQLISKYNEGIKFLLCVIDIFSKYAWEYKYSFFLIFWE